MSTLSFVATSSVYQSHSPELLQQILSIAVKYHDEKEWFLVYKPTDGKTRVEDGNNNVFVEADFELQDKLYTVYDLLEDGSRITVMYSSEY